MAVSIIIPTRNEELNIAPLLAGIAKTLASRASDTEVIFIDDGSTDRTRENICNYKGSLQVRLICRDGVTGLATAVVAGAKVARGELLVVMDADLSHPPERIPDLLLPLQNGSHDMAIGSRYVQGGSSSGWPLRRRLASWLATLPARLFTEVSDPLAGFFAVRREELLAITRPVVGFKIGLEILATTGDRLRVTEIPITFSDRRQGQSKMGTAVLFAYLRQLTALCGFPKENIDHKQLTVLTGIVVSLDILLFLILQSADLQLDVIHITSYLLACNLGYIVTAATTTKPLSHVGPSAFLRYHAVLLPILFFRGGIVTHISTWYSGKGLLLPLAVASCSMLASVIGFLVVTSKTNSTSNSKWGYA